MANTTLKTYRAPTMGEALAQLKKELGKEAVILHTRAYKVGSILGFFGKPMVEITASVGVNVVNPLDLRKGARRSEQPAERAPASQAPARSGPVAVPPRMVQQAYGNTRAGSSGDGGGTATATPEPRRPVRDEVEPSYPKAAVEAVAEANKTGSAGMSASLYDEISAIKRMVTQVLQSSTQGGVGMGGGPAPAMPEALLKFYLKLIQNNVSQEIADELAASLRDELTPAELGDEQIVRQSTLRHLETLIPTDTQVSAPDRRPGGRPLTIALVGPTGVGKTTTVAKLAAAYRLRHGKKVALVTSDTYRIAAVEQLRTYANIIGVPLHVAHSPDQMADAVAECHDCDVILIDTAGRSPSDTGRLEELRDFLAAAQPHQVHLVLASVACEGALMRTAEQFALVNPTRVIFTKLDEAASFGVLVNVARKLKTKLSFVTTGQEVPDDIEPGRADRLARLILDGSVAA